MVAVPLLDDAVAAHRARQPFAYKCYVWVARWSSRFRGPKRAAVWYTLLAAAVVAAGATGALSPGNIHHMREDHRTYMSTLFLWGMMVSGAVVAPLSSPPPWVLSWPLWSSSHRPHRHAPLNPPPSAL